MANPANPQNPLGATTTPNSYPQWGYNSAYKIVEAKTAAQKEQYIQQGYLVWFATAQAAKNSVTGQKTPFLNGNIPNPIPSFSLVFGNTSGLLTRILKIGFGGILLIAGIMRLTGADKDILQIAGASMKGMI